MSRDALAERYIWARYHGTRPRSDNHRADVNYDADFATGFRWVRDHYFGVDLRDIARLMHVDAGFATSVLASVGRERNEHVRYAIATNLHSMLRQLGEVA